jgi:hypothetical protein
MFGKEQYSYTCGSLFIDHASGKLFNFPQYSNTALETIRGTLCLEAMALEKGFSIKEYHPDNGIFVFAEFKEHCVQQEQDYSFSGVGAKHQNCIAECNINTVAQWARTNMLHLATHWPQYANSKYWPQAIDYSVWVYNRLNFPQYSNTALETIRSTLCLEAMALEKGFSIKEYHPDNGIFVFVEFKEHCVQQEQDYSFSGVGAKHQNGIAERNINTVAQWARANMLHLATHWPQYANSKYWPQAIDYSVWVYNRLVASIDFGIPPNEIWSGVRSPGSKLLRALFFGCPVFVLDTFFQDGKKIPKWNPRAWLASFLNSLIYTPLRLLWS